MSQTGAEFFTNALEQYGVTHVFGNPGTTELPIMEAISDSDLEYVLSLHEDVAVGMAAGYATTHWRKRNEADSVLPLGVVNLHVAPGVVHGLGNLFDSGPLGSGAPLLVTAGRHSTEHQHREPNLHGDLVRLTEQFTKWSAEVKHINAFPSMLRRAIRVAQTPPTGPVFLSFPIDVMRSETTAEPERLGSITESGEASSDSVAEAVHHLSEARNPVMVVGDLLSRAGQDGVEAAVSLAEAIGMRVYGEFRLSEVAFPTDHPQWMGGLPDDPDRASGILDSDVILFVGTISNVPTVVDDMPDGSLPGTTSIHVSDSAWEIGKNYVVDIGLLGNPARIVEQFAETLGGSVADAELESRLEAMDEFRLDTSAPSARETPDDGPAASKFDLATGLVAAAPDARVFAEAITTKGALVDAYDFEPGQFSSFRGGGLGYGLPASIGMAIAEREHDAPRDVIGVIGDGSFLFYPNALYSAARYDVDVTIVVADNRNYRVLKNNMVGLFGGEMDDYEFVGMDFEPPVDIPGNAESHGARGELVDDPARIAEAVASAVADRGPTVLDVLIHD